jgi:hypothetical protein
VSNPTPVVTWAFDQFYSVVYRFDAYLLASQQVTIAQATLTSATTASAQIDRVLTDLITSVCTSLVPVIPIHSPY